MPQLRHGHTMTHRIRISVDARIDILEGVLRVTHDLFSTENTLRQCKNVVFHHGLFFWRFIRNLCRDGLITRNKDETPKERVLLYLQ